MASKTNLENPADQFFSKAVETNEIKKTTPTVKKESPKKPVELSPSIENSKSVSTDTKKISTIKKISVNFYLSQTLIDAIALKISDDKILRKKNLMQAK